MHTILIRKVMGETLRELRMTSGMTLREASETSRVSLGYLSEIERGHKEASSEVLAAVAAALGIPISQVLQLVGEKAAVLEGERARGVTLAA